MESYFTKRAITLKKTIKKYNINVNELCQLLGITDRTFRDWCDPSKDTKLMAKTKAQIYESYPINAVEFLKEKFGNRLKPKTFPSKEFISYSKSFPYSLIDYLEGKNICPDLWHLFKTIHGHPDFFKKDYRDQAERDAIKNYHLDKVQFSARGWRTLIEACVWKYGIEAENALLETNYFRRSCGHIEPNYLFLTAKENTEIYKHLERRNVFVDLHDKNMMKVITRGYIHYNREMFEIALKTKSDARTRKNKIEPFTKIIETGSEFQVLVRDATKLQTFSKIVETIFKGKSNFYHDRVYANPQYMIENYHPYYCHILTYVGRLLIDMNIEAELKIYHPDFLCVGHTKNGDCCRFLFPYELSELIFVKEVKPLQKRLKEYLIDHEYVRQQEFY